MQNWQTYYKEHLVTMDEAAKSIRSGDTLWTGMTISVPYNFLNKLNELRDGLENVTIIDNLSLGMFDILFDEESKKHFHFFSLFTGPLDRMSGDMGIADFHSVSYEHAVRTVMETYGATIEVTEVLPPDENGFVNVGILGVGMDGEVHKDSRIKKRIAIVNKNQSRAPGKFKDFNFPVTDFDMFVEDTHELPVLPVSEPTENDVKIASYIMPYIKDGDAVQIGMGGLGEQITKSLYEKQNIRIYSEISVDSMIPLVEAGNAKELVCCGCFGSQRLYDFLGTNKAVTMKNIWDMMDPNEIGHVDDLVAINSTLMIDLTGQACSEAQGVKQYSSVGGSFTYIYGAIRSNGGRSFMCLRSTYKDKDGERHSNVVAYLPEKSVVTTPRFLVMYVVTEYGVADIFLRTNKERIKALLKIANPDFVSELKEQIIATGQITAEELGE